MISQKPINNTTLKNTNDWRVPIPLLVTEKQAIPYPVDALPSILANAVNAYQSYGQQPGERKKVWGN